ncbi:efflux RND transporter periplasmic adaptor subunit [bacterium]|nr:MAG: efflux RND transporter periplasmic adaptor subunit [bacterium]
MKTTLLITLYTITALLASCSGSTTDTGRQPTPPNVSVHTITASEIPQDFIYTGNIEGDRRVSLSTKIMGQIISMPFDEGSLVAAGQSVVKIKSDDISAKRGQVKANLTEAQAALKNVEINYQRIKSLYESKSATKKEMDDIEMAYHMAKARVSSVEEMEKEVSDVMEYGDIVTPIKGYVIKKIAQEGDMAVPGMPLLIIEDMTTLKINTRVPETEVHLFKKGDRVKVHIDALPETELTGKVDQINPGGNPASRQFEVKVTLDGVSNAHRQAIKSGMYARVILEKGFTKSVLIPENILIRRGQLEGVFVISDNNTAMLRWIRTGNQNGDRIEILSGLQDGEKIVITSDVKISDGQKVEVAQ